MDFAIARLRACAMLGLASLAWLGVVTVAVAQPVTNVAVFQYAIFYNGLLEFSTCSSLFINGPTHANSNIYVGSSSPLTFNAPVTTSGTISSPSNNGTGPWAFPGKVTFNASPAYATNLPPLLPVLGTNFTGSNYLHNIIDLPPAGESLNSSEAQARLYNQASIILVVTDTNITAQIQCAPALGQLPAADPVPAIIKMTNFPPINLTSATNLYYILRTNFPFLQVTNKFYDQREDKTNLVTQIDVAKYRLWTSTNLLVQGKYPAASGLFPLILYVADNRANTTGQLSCVRLTNGIALPANGLAGWTVVTPNPLYIWGDYNCTNASHLGTSNTTSAVPSALISDALTILSANWQDNTSFTDDSSGPNASALTTINAAIITGIKASTSSALYNFSGGVHNLPRFLEDWGLSHLWLNTAIACLYTSTKATKQFVPPGSSSYYVPPTRHFNYDVKFANLLSQPPGTPFFNVPTGLWITTAPQGRNVITGENATFSVAATSYLPLSFQWQFEGADIAGATGSSLTLTNVTADQAGNYSVVVSNSTTFEASGPALLSVYPTAAANLMTAGYSENHQFQFAITGVPGFHYVVEASTNLIDWTPLLTNSPPFLFTDTNSPALPLRFYRSTYLP